MTGIERLRTFADMVPDTMREALQRIANQIERETFMRPTFEDGEPVQWGDKYDVDGDVGTVYHIEFMEDSWNVWSPGHTVAFSDYGPLKRPEQPDTWEMLEHDVEELEAMCYDIPIRVCYDIPIRGIFERAKKLAEVE